MPESDDDTLGLHEFVPNGDEVVVWDVLRVFVVGIELSDSALEYDEDWVAEEEPDKDSDCTELELDGDGAAERVALDVVELLRVTVGVAA